MDLNDKYLLDLEKELSEKSSEMILFSKMGGSLFPFILFFSFLFLVFFVTFTAGFFKDYFESIKYKKILIKQKEEINEKDKDVLESKINLGINLRNYNSNKNKLNLSLFEKLIYPFLSVYVLFLGIIEDIMYEVDELLLYLSAIVSVFLLAGGVVVFLYNRDVVMDVYSEGVYSELEKSYVEKEYPIYVLNTNVDSSGYEVQYYKEDNSINKKVVNNIFVDENLTLLDKNSIGVITFINYNEYISFIDSTDLESLNLSNTLINTLNGIKSSTYNSPIVKDVKILEMPKF